MAAYFTDIIIAGGANLDIKWRAMHKILLGTTTISQKSEHYGGVARNIAEGLARLGMPVRFFSCVGHDDRGQRMIADLAHKGVDISLVRFSYEHTTATYCAILHPSGELYASVIDMAIYDECCAREVEVVLASIHTTSIMVLDTDLSNATLSSLVEAQARATWVSLTCVAAVNKIKPLLGYIDVLFLNQQEFLALCPAEYSFEQQCAWLHAQGLKAVVITRGAEGLMMSDGHHILALPAQPATVVEVTGAGDALVAGTLYDYVQGKSLRESLLLGLKASGLTLQSYESVSPRLHELV